MNTNIDLYSLPVDERMKMIKQLEEDGRSDMWKIVKFNAFLYSVLAVIIIGIVLISSL